VTQNGQALLSFSGSGERTTIGQKDVTVGSSQVQAIFEYQSNGQWAKSKLQSGGPYAVGKYNFIVLASESGDDKDYNDSIMEVSWNS